MEGHDSDPGGVGRRLRRSTLAHQPGRYSEMLVTGIEKPAFTIPDPVFDPETSCHCAFPTIDLNQQPGPSELFKEARARGELEDDTQRQAPFDEDNNQNSRPALVAYLPLHDNNETDDISFSGDYHDAPYTSRDPRRGESYKEFILSITQGLDWGSPEPEPELEPQLVSIYNHDREDLSHSRAEPLPVQWSHIDSGVQWAIIATLCQVYPFSVAIQKLQLTTQQVTTFVQTYVQCNEKIAEWCEVIDRIPVSHLVRYAEDGGMCVDEYIHLTRPELPTDILFLFQVEQARNFLRKIHQSELVEILGKWRGISRNFVELPIEPDILAICRSMMYLNRGCKPQDFRPIIDREPICWLERLRDDSDFNSSIPHFYNYYGNPFAYSPNNVSATNLRTTMQPETPASDMFVGPTQNNHRSSRQEQNDRAQNQTSWSSDGASFSQGHQLCSKNLFKRSQDYHKTGLDHEARLSASRDAPKASKQMRDSQVASIMMSHQQRKDAAQQSQNSQGSTNFDTPRTKLQGFAKNVSSHGPMLFRKSASELGSYTFMTAKRGSGSYTSPYVIDTASMESEPQLELNISKAIHDQHKTMRISEVQGSIHDNVPVSIDEGRSVDSFIINNVAKFDNEIFLSPPHRNMSTKGSHKRTAEEECAPYDDKDNDYRYPALKKARKSNVVRSNANTGAIKYNQSPAQKKKTVRSSGVGKEPLKRPRGRPRKNLKLDNDCI